jgi:hypothetical protein
MKPLPLLIALVLAAGQASAATSWITAGDTAYATIRKH